MPHALDTASILSLQAHSGNAALAELLGGERGAEGRLRVSGYPSDGGRAEGPGAPADAGGRVVDLRSHRPLGHLQRAGAGSPGMVVQLQGAVACPEPPVTAPPVEPHDDPGFQKVEARIGGVAAEKKKHSSPKSKADEAGAAAVAPPTEGPSQAAAAQVDDMHEQKPGTFDKKAFVAAVHKAIEAATPKTMEEVDSFKSSGKAAAMGSQVAGQVSSSKDAAAKDIKDASTAAPDSSKADVKAATPMQQESAGAPPGEIGAGQAMPPPKAADQVHLDHTRCETDSKLAEAKVTDQMVAESNEPDFHGAMDAKRQADEHAATAPQAARQSEQATLTQSKGDAAAAGNQGVAGMHDAKAGALTATAGHQERAKGANEAERAKVSAHITQIYETTKADVDKILADLDTQVDSAFKEGEKAAHDAFVSHVDARKTAFFDERYSGVEGALLWAKDKLTSPPPEVNAFIEEGRQLYLQRMDGVIDQVADLVGAQLTAAKTRIATGRKEIKDYVDSLKGDLKEVGQQAQADIGAKFDQLDQDVESKQSAVVDSLAEKYVEARKAVDAEVDKMKEENKGLLDRAMDAVGGMIDTILKMKAMLAGILAKAGDVLDAIISRPIAFLENLGSAVKQGLGQFVDNIATHLKEGLTGWLFGELASAGISLPETLDLKGLLHLAGQVLGFTWDHIKEIAKKVLGERVVAMIEKGAAAFQKVMDIFDVVKKEGLAGIWHMIQEKLSDLEDSMLGQIKDFVITKVITAGVTWIVSLLNPASAFIKACKAIYDFVMFIVERGSQIMEFVNAILDNLGAIASGALGAAANLVEGALAKALPLAISMLASLLGLGGIGEKIKEVITAARAPVDKALHWLMSTVIKPLARIAMKGIGWVAGKVKAGVAWVKGKAKAGIDKLKARFGRKPDEQPAATALDPVPFDVEGNEHRAYLSTSTVMVASNPQPISQFVAAVVARLAQAPPGVQTQARQLAGQINALLPHLRRPGPEADRQTTLALIASTLKDLIVLVKSLGKKSVSVAYYDVMGQHGEMAALSGERAQAGRSTVARFYQTLAFSDIERRDPQRHHDSELKLLEEITDRFGTRQHPLPPGQDTALSTRRFPEVTGEVHLVSDFVFCPSCSWAIGQFRRTFPAVRLIADTNLRPLPGSLN